MVATTGALVVGTFEVGAFVVATTGALVVGAFEVGAFEVGALVVGAVGAVVGVVLAHGFVVSSPMHRPFAVTHLHPHILPQSARSRIRVKTLESLI